MGLENLENQNNFQVANMKNKNSRTKMKFKLIYNM